MQDAQPKSAVKGSRKTVPASFVEVIDTLLDAVSNYQGVILSADTKPEGAYTPTSLPQPHNPPTIFSAMLEN